MDRSATSPLRRLMLIGTLQLCLLGALVGSGIAAFANSVGGSVALSKSCSGPGPNGTVAAGQTDTCTVRLTSGTLNGGSTVRITPTSPQGATATCSHSVQGANGCEIQIAQNLVPPATISTESLDIPSGAG